MFPDAYKRLRICALDPYDLALSKPERNIRRDRDDVKHLAHSIPPDLKILRDRYEKKLRWERKSRTRGLNSETVERNDRGGETRGPVNHERLLSAYFPLPPKGSAS
jgi:hypothetical protein